MNPSNAFATDRKKHCSRFGAAISRRFIFAEERI